MMRLFTLSPPQVLNLSQKKREKCKSSPVLCVRLQGKRQPAWDCLLSSFPPSSPVSILKTTACKNTHFHMYQKPGNGFKLDKQADNEVEK